MQDCFGESGTADELLRRFGLTPEAAAELGRQAVALKRR
jgi:hypothetical protein